MAWVPMIDISRHQGVVNFATMRGKGVPYVIMRATHASREDDAFERYYRDALRAGYKPDDIGFYCFLNPKRGTGAQTARDTAQIIRRVTGRTDVLYMLDLESNAHESPNAGTPMRITSQYVRSHRDAFVAAMPGCRIIAYSNAAFWNSSQGPADAALAAELEWIVPRYPAYSTARYERVGYPPAPPQWDEYAFRLAPGPYPPLGADWLGWQFSAGYNRQGPVYGCQSSDLDLNILDADAAARWFTSAPTPEPEGDPMFIVKSSEDGSHHIGDRLLRRYIADPVPEIEASARAGSPLKDWVTGRDVTAAGQITAASASTWADELGVPIGDLKGSADLSDLTAKVDGLTTTTDRINARVDGLHRKVDALETPANQDLTIRLTGTASADTA